MKREKAERIVKIYNCLRFVLAVAALAFLFVAAARAENRTAEAEEQTSQPQQHALLYRCPSQPIGAVLCQPLFYSQAGGRHARCGLSGSNHKFPTDIRLNYEKYWYPHGGAKESEQDKLVCELVINY